MSASCWVWKQEVYWRKNEVVDMTGWRQLVQAAPIPEDDQVLGNSRDHSHSRGRSCSIAFTYQCAVGTCFGNGSESLDLQRYTIGYAANQANPTVLTMWITNTGTGTAVVSSFSIHDLNGPNPVSIPISVSIPPKASGTVTLDTSSAGFHFMRGHTYSVTAVTSRFQFAFPISYN